MKAHAAPNGIKLATPKPVKLRIHGNSIRLRLTRSEVERFAHDGSIESVLNFGPAPARHLSYGLVTSPQPECMAVKYSPDRITIFVSPALAKDWTTTERIAISDRQPLSDEAHLDILVEKEFGRLRDAQPDPDLYPNPLRNKRSPQEGR
jgi:hypothetical protein